MISCFQMRIYVDSELLASDLCELQDSELKVRTSFQMDTEVNLLLFLHTEELVNYQRAVSKLRPQRFPGGHGHGNMHLPFCTTRDRLPQIEMGSRSRGNALSASNK